MRKGFFLCSVLLVMLSIFCSLAVMAADQANQNSVPPRADPAKNAQADWDKHIKDMVDYFQPVHKARFVAADWYALGKAMEEKGNYEQAKKIYTKAYELANTEASKAQFAANDEDMGNPFRTTARMDADALDYIRQQSIISLSGIYQKQNDNTEALAIYDKICPDSLCTEPDLLRAKADLVRNMGDTLRADKLAQQAVKMAKAKRLAESLPLPPFLAVLGLFGAAMLIGLFSRKKKITRSGD